MNIYEITFLCFPGISLLQSALMATVLGALVGVPWALGAYWRREVLR